MGSVLKFLRWVAQKAAFGALIIVLGIAACGLWLYVRDNVGFEEWRQDSVRLITGERRKLVAAMADVQKRMQALSAEMKVEQERLQQADKVVAQLKALDSTWDRYVGDREQQKRNDERLASVTALRQATADKLARQKEDFTRATWERDGLQIALGKLDVQLRSVEARRSEVMHYVEKAWNYDVGIGYLRGPLHWWVLFTLGGYFVGPTAGKVFLYFMVAPLIARGRPVRLRNSLDALPEISDSRVSVELALGAGETLWVKERFLQASDEGVARKTRYLLDWHIPFTCLAAGLVELIEVAHKTEGAGHRRVTLSNQADPHSELAVVTLPEASSIIMRPSFLAGIVTSDGQPVKIRRRWQLLRWQSWITLQFRFFEFVGPCRLLLAGSRGVRAENLADRDGMALPARRANQDAIVGFTPNLDYRPVRAEAFWSYYRGMNPLFDDLFVGRGVFLCQQVATDGAAKNARKFWAGVWGGFTKIFGL